MMLGHESVHYYTEQKEQLSVTLLVSLHVFIRAKVIQKCMIVAHLTSFLPGHP